MKGTPHSNASRSADEVLRDLVQTRVPPPPLGYARELREQVIAAMESRRMAPDVSRSVPLLRRRAMPAFAVAACVLLAASFASALAWRIHRNLDASSADIVALTGRSEFLRDRAGHAPASTAVASADAPATTGGDLPGAPAPAPAVPPAAIATSAGGARSTLAKENALLADAMAQHRAHRGRRALALLDELLHKYPGTPLAETARVERLRVLAEVGDAAILRREAERYLADYPRGQARDEVARMIASAPAPSP